MTFHRRTTADVLRQALRDSQTRVNTAIPGYITAFDTETQLAQVQIGIRRVDTEGNTFVPPVIIECPVHFPGGTFSIEYEIQPNDEGLIIFSQRCIDSWIDNGGVSENPIMRLHDINDAMFIPGIRSQRKRLSNFKNNGIMMRNEDGSNFIWLRNDGTADIKVTTMIIDGDLQINGETIGSGEGTFDGISVSKHTHPQGQDSGGNAEQDTGDPK